MPEFGADAEQMAAFARKINDRFVALNSKFCMDIQNCILLGVYTVQKKTVEDYLNEVVEWSGELKVRTENNKLIFVSCFWGLKIKMPLISVIQLQEDQKEEH